MPWYFRLFFVTSFATLVACGAELTADVTTPARAFIVNGTRDPQNLVLTPGQVLAVGYMAGSDGSAFCSGTLVAPRAVVTAEHCVDGRTAESTFFGFGEQPSSPAALLPVAIIHRHPTLDLAMLILGELATDAMPEVTPISINRAALDDTWLGDWVNAAGYGDTYSSDTGRFFASVEIVEYDAGTVTVWGHGEQGICYGDSGGPILWQESSSSEPLLVGAESWGDSSCTDYDHLTRVDVAAQWIDARIAEPFEPCDDDTYSECTGGTAVWCTSGYMHRDDCAAQGLACGWLGPDSGYRCLPAACGETDALGRCDGDLLIWCRGGGVATHDCGRDGLTCAWQDDSVGYICKCIECDGVCTDVTASLAHCGACGQACAPAHAAGACEAGTCKVATCMAGYRDADGDAANGCEGKEGGCAATGSAVALAALASAWLLLLLGARRRVRRPRG